MPRPRSWTDDDLRRAVANARTLRDVCRELGRRPGGVTYRSIREDIERLQLDARHLRLVAGGRDGSARRWSDDDLRTAVDCSMSMSEVQRRLGFEPNGGMHRCLTRHVKRLGLDTSHFTGQSWARGKTLGASPRRIALADILVNGSLYSSGALRKRLIAAGLKDEMCEGCGSVEWLGQPIQLELDHINGDHYDNRLVNLRVLCPNCHAMTETWCRAKARSLDA